MTSAIGNPIDNCEHDQTHRPVRNFEEGKNLCRDLNQQPTNDRVRDRNLVNIAPLQLGEEVVGLHCVGAVSGTTILPTNS